MQAWLIRCDNRRLARNLTKHHLPLVKDLLLVKCLLPLVKHLLPVKHLPLVETMIRMKEKAEPPAGGDKDSGDKDSNEREGGRRI